MAYFNKPLEENEKVPLSHYCMTTLISRGEPNIMCSEGDLQRIFRVSENEADYLWTILKMAIVTGAPDGDGTKASFISFWDDNIRKILSATFAPNRVARDSNREMSTRHQLPDFGFLKKNDVCIFRGEEKPPHYSGKHPKDELFKKLKWTYHPAPWILGQYFNATSFVTC
jgi:hypothetical protein